MNADPINADPAELAKFSALAHRWWDPGSEFKPLHDINPLRLDYITGIVGPLAGRRIADVGCGGGILSESMAGQGAQVVGLDLSEKALAVAKLHQLESNIAVDYRLQSAESLALESPAAFDLVTCMEMLEHVPNPSQIIAACAALLKPGGHLIVSTINRNPKAYLLAVIGAEYVLRLLPRGTHDYAKLLKPAEVAAFARKAGLIVTQMTGMTYNPLSRVYRLEPDTSVNYLMALRRPARDG